jgi:hypothetical protein
LDDKPVPRGCISPFAPEWIAAVINKQKIRLKQAVDDFAA